ncbi:hypothetical protein LCGC14_1043940, partial [marine sediment metagenome]
VQATVIVSVVPALPGAVTAEGAAVGAVDCAVPPLDSLPPQNSSYPISQYDHLGFSGFQIERA